MRNRLLQGLLVLMGLLGALSLGSARAADPIVIYDDALQAGWQDWSWSSGQSLSHSGTVHGGTRSISLVQGGWGGLYLHTAAISTTGYGAVTFWAHGGPAGGQQLQVHARDTAGNPLTSVALAPLPAGQWRQYSVELSALDAQDRQITGFVIQNATAAALPQYFVDDIGLSVAPTRQVLYDDQLRNGWTPGSHWNISSNTANTSPVHSGARSIAVTPTGAWGQFYFDKDGFSTADFDTVELWAHGGTAGGQVLAVDAFRAGTFLGSSVLAPLTAGQWTRFEVPLADLGAANTTIDVLAIKYYSDTAGPRFYLDDLAMVGQGTGPSTVSMSGLHVQGNRLLNGQGQALFIHGVNRGTTGFECVHGYDATPRDQAFVDAVKSWNANAVRVPLNEQCWLGINATSANAPYMGAPYRQAIIDYVNLMTANNLAVIVDLHYAMPGQLSTSGLDLQPMPNADHSVAFWTSVANAFKGNSAVIFDLYNEPYLLNDPPAAEAWSCWRNGGSSCSVKVTEGYEETDISYTAVGMQTLVDTVRATGAKNVIMVGGLGSAGDLSHWLAYKPTDPENNIIASWHQYNFAVCTSQQCWETEVGPVMDQVPLIVGEHGMANHFGSSCDTDYLDRLWAFVEGKKQGYMAWNFNTWPGTCGTSDFNIGLITDESGTPSSYGSQYYNHLQGLPSAYAN
ncbi:glycoside hydrolase family 5 protein [Inquilinus limosus]|uniref:glycoside hydrolase family 5 protein n=1 Tax=Inquilinus limosus TaxID=171674 RepID=UPI003F18A54E